MKNIEDYRKRFNSLLETTMGDVRPLINEEFETSGTTGSTLTLVAGPIGDGYLKRYIYKENDRFFIYYSTFKNPEHKLDTSLEDEGRGFQTKQSAMKKIFDTTPRNMGTMDEEYESVYTDSNEEISYDIQSVDCGGDFGGSVNIDEDDTIVIRYCEGDDEELEYLKEKGKRLLYRKYGM